MTDQPQDAAAVEAADAVDLESTSGDVPGRDGGPQETEAMQAADGLTASPDVAASYDDMLERGAEQQGEGRVP